MRLNLWIVAVWIQLGFAQEPDGQQGSDANDRDLDTNATSASIVTVAPACNPYLEVCPDYENGIQTCTLPLSSGALVLQSPNASDFFYIGNPILVNASYTRLSNPDYPQDGISCYYRRLGSETYRHWGDIPSGLSHTYLTLDLVSAGSYQVLCLVDNVDPTLRSKVGKQASCVPDGWPYSAPVGFRLLQPSYVVAVSNPVPPNTSSSLSLSLSVVVSSFLVLPVVLLVVW